MHLRFALAFLIAARLAAQNKPGDWPMYNHDIGSTRYSALNQITVANVGKLALVWTFPTREPTPRAADKDQAKGGLPGFGIGAQAVPIVVGNVMYLPAGNLVVAVEADMGKEIWRYRLPLGQASTHGVAYWPGDKENSPRILFTSGRNLIALNAATGKLDQVLVRRASSTWWSPGAACPPL